MKPSYSLEALDVKIENEHLTINNFDKLGGIDKACIVKIGNGTEAQYFKPSESDEKIGYAILSHGDTMQNRTKKWSMS